MYYMNHDAVDYFRVDFTVEDSIVVPSRLSTP